MCNLWQHLSKFYHSIYVYATILSVTFFLLLHQMRQHLYTLPLTWSEVFVVYCCTGIMAVMLTLIAFYGWTTTCLLRRQYQLHEMASKRAMALFKFYDMQKSAASAANKPNNQ